MKARHDFSHQIASPHFPNRVPHHVVLEIARLVSNDNVEFTAVAEAVDSHPAMASILIRAANSAELGTIQQVRSLRHALAILGLQRIRGILHDLQAAEEQLPGVGEHLGRTA